MVKDVITSGIDKALGELGFSVPVYTLEHPTDLSHGDYASNVAFILGKEASKNPKKIAEDIVQYIEKHKLKEIEKMEVAGPGFINFHLTRDFFVQSVSTVIKQGPKWGGSTLGKTEKWLLEHTSPNPNKAMHIGHLRNNIVGMAIANIAEANGVEVVRDAVDNNRGIAIAKLMWGYLKFSRKDDKVITDIQYWHDHQDEWDTPSTKNMRPDRFIDELYVKGSEDFENDLVVAKQIRQFVVDWEQKNVQNLALWKKVIEYSHEGQNMTLDRLGSRWDKVWHEHEHYEEGKNLVEEGLKKGVFKKLEDGAVLTDLEQYGLPDTILIKSDGTSLYITQDLALTKLKREEFSPDKLFWVIGPDQSLALKQLFAVCEQLGIGKVNDYTHISYGYMSVKGQGKMSSRKGNVLFIDDLLDNVKAHVKKQMSNRDFTQSALEEISEKIALSAVKFGILKTSRGQDTSFDIQSAVSFQGDSGPYLQYTNARAHSILEKALNVEEIKTVPFQITDVERFLYRFPEVVLRAFEECEPHYIATYLIQLASAFNSWYASGKVLDGSPEEAYKLALTKATSITLKNGLGLLGIKTPDRM